MKEDQEMKTALFLLIVITLVLVSSNFVFSDCVDLKRSNSWYAQGGHTIIFYVGFTPVARVDVRNCPVKPSSTIRLMTNYTCDSDSIVIDGEVCSIMTVSSSSSSP
jgi:hypothetical protein